jgi:hypothetical protein
MPGPTPTDNTSNSNSSAANTSSAREPEISQVDASAEDVQNYSSYRQIFLQLALQQERRAAEKKNGMNDTTNGDQEGADGDAKNVNGNGKEHGNREGGSAA